MFIRKNAPFFGEGRARFADDAFGRINP